MERAHDQGKCMKKLFATFIAVFSVCLAPSAWADWHTVTVHKLYLNVDSPKLMVLGTFSPALPCGSQMFFLLPADPMFKETYAMLIAAQHTQTHIQYLHVYCDSNGIGRGNQYMSGP